MYLFYVRGNFEKGRIGELNLSVYSLISGFFCSGSSFTSYSSFFAFLPFLVASPLTSAVAVYCLGFLPLVFFSGTTGSFSLMGAASSLLLFFEEKKQ
jgi:hypothetical protein